MRDMLARFISRIELGNHRLKVWYTWPLDQEVPIVKGTPRGAHAAGGSIADPNPVDRRAISKSVRNQHLE